MNPQDSEMLRGLGAVTPPQWGHAQNWRWSIAAAATGPLNTGVNHSNSNHAEPLTARSAHRQEAPTRNNMSDMAGVICLLLLPQWQENTRVMPHREVPHAEMKTEKASLANQVKKKKKKLFKEHFEILRTELT